VVEDEDEFARTLIPELFKHNNYASFVRQLNMYGFHKKVGLSDNSMRASERKNKVPSEYYNKHFKRGRPDLLWLIQKPKAAAGKKGTRGKQNGQVGEDDGDEFDLDTPTADRFPDGANTQGGRQPLLIGEGSSAQQKQLSVVHQELQAIRQQQVMISQVIQKLRREHEQLYGQAAAFQDLHNRHENSINAILTFLATVYNRSLEGHGTQQLAALFAGNIPTDTSQPPHGNIVDIGDSFVAEGLANQYNRPPQRRQPLLLKAPPSASNENGMGKVYSTTPTPSPETPTPQTAGRATASPQLNNRSQRNNTPGRTFQQGNATPNMGNVDIMALINSANATDTRNLNNRMNFPEALNHLQTADGKSPLSTMQRNSMLQMIAANNNNNNNSSTQPSSASSPAFNFTTGPSANNALTSPSPPAFPGPDIQQWKASGDELDFLERTLKEQDDKVAHLSNMLTPLSPSGSIPGLGSSTDYVHLPSDQLDLDQIFNSRDYFTGADSAGTFDFGPGPADFDDNFGLDSANDFTTGDFDGTGNVQGDGHGYGNGAVENGTGGLLDASGSRIVETTESSAATSPSVTVEDVQDGGEEAEGGARKKRKRI
jgi:heat shock transcription factor